MMDELSCNSLETHAPALYDDCLLITEQRIEVMQQGVITLSTPGVIYLLFDIGIKGQHILVIAETDFSNVLLNQLINKSQPHLTRTHDVVRP